MSNDAKDAEVVDAQPMLPTAGAQGADMLTMPPEVLAPRLEQYDATREVWRKWFLGHLIEGVHYGFPPGVRVNKNVDPKKWQAKPSLYKAGALLLCDLLRMRATFEADEVAWQQLGSKEGTFVMKCVLVRQSDADPLGEGRGVFEPSDNKGMNGNSRIKMAEKRALVDAVIHTVAFCSDVFTQDMEDLPDRSAPEGEYDKQPRGAHKPQRGGSTKPASEKQANFVSSLMEKEAGWTSAQQQAYLKENFGVDSVDALTSRQASEAITYLKDYKPEKKGGADEPPEAEPSKPSTMRCPDCQEDVPLADGPCPNCGSDMRF